MAIDSIGALGQVSTTTAQSSVGLEDFLNIFLAQLNYQDPLEPVDNREFIAQLAQFSSVEIANRTSETAEALLDITSLSQSIGLLGRTVNVSLDSGLVAGQVIAMSLVNQQPVLSIRGQDGTVFTAGPSQVSTVIDNLTQGD